MAAEAVAATATTAGNTHQQAASGKGAAGCRGSSSCSLHTIRNLIVSHVGTPPLLQGAQESNINRLMFWS